MKNCTLCGAAYSDWVDFCFDDGAILQQEQGGSVTVEFDLEETDAPLPGNLVFGGVTEVQTKDEPTALAFTPVPKPVVSRQPGYTDDVKPPVEPPSEPQPEPAPASKPSEPEHPAAVAVTDDAVMDEVPAKKSNRTLFVFAGAAATTFVGLGVIGAALFAGAGFYAQNKDTSNEEATTKQFASAPNDTKPHSMPSDVGIADENSAQAEEIEAEVDIDGGVTLATAPARMLRLAMMSRRIQSWHPHLLARRRRLLRISQMLRWHLSKPIAPFGTCCRCASSKSVKRPGSIRNTMAGASKPSVTGDKKKVPAETPVDGEEEPPSPWSNTPAQDDSIVGAADEPVSENPPVVAKRMVNVLVLLPGADGEMVNLTVDGTPMGQGKRWPVRLQLAEGPHVFTVDQNGTKTNHNMTVVYKTSMVIMTLK